MNDQNLSLGTLVGNGNSNSVRWGGGEGEFRAFGTFGGGTLTLQMSDDNSTFWNVDKTGDTYVTLTANGGGAFRAGPCYLRANLAGATGPSIAASVLGTRTA